MTEYSVEEVRAIAAAERGSTDRYVKIRIGMLTAYADLLERIKAGEGAHGRIDFNGMWNAMSDRSDAPLPAQAAQADLRNSLLRGKAQNEEPRLRHSCNMGVGCEEYGVCYAEAHGQPEQCGRPTAEPVAQGEDGMQPSRPKPRMPVSPLGIEDFCFCNNEVSLQSVSGGAAPEGYLGRVRLKINDEFVSYVRESAQPAERVPEARTWITAHSDTRNAIVGLLRDEAHEREQADDSTGIFADLAGAMLLAAIADALEADTLWATASPTASPTPSPAQPAERVVEGCARYIDTGNARWDSAAFQAWREGSNPGSDAWIKRIRELLTAAQQADR